MAISPAAFSEFGTSYMSTGYMTPFGESSFLGFAGNMASNFAFESVLTRSAYGTFASGVAQTAGMQSKAFADLATARSLKQNPLQRFLGTSQPSLPLSREISYTRGLQAILGATNNDASLFLQGTKKRALFGQSRPVAQLAKYAKGNALATEALEKAFANTIEVKLPFGKAFTMPGGLKTAMAFETAGLVAHGAAKFFGAQAIMQLATGVADVQEYLTSSGRQMRKQKEFTMTQMSGQFFDNRGAATMRQRSIAAIHNTQSQLQQVFGREATVVHA